jgi:CheY-like chemotaxis protein
MDNFDKLNVTEMKRSGPIVVIDDDPDDQYLYKKTLERLNVGHDIVIFDNGIDALHYFKQVAEKPFLILCDINMPLMTGIEMRREMCGMPELCKKNIPFIFMSTSARQTDIDQATSLYTHGFFLKEASFDKHETTLKKIIDYWSGCRYSESLVA